MAEYYKGLTIECDSFSPRLTIEGRRIRVKQTGKWYCTDEEPIVKKTSLAKLAQAVIVLSPAHKKRETVKKAHLQNLKKGVKSWNRWREENPEIRPILYDADLRESKLGFKLNKANFTNAVLINANLKETSLRGANFHEANLGGAKLWVQILPEPIFVGHIFIRRSCRRPF